MERVQVVVIGAGIAGITAARDISAQGIEVKILEALPRTGGRINTVSVDGRNYDLGASWMHETLVNPLFEVAIRKKIFMAYDDEVLKTYIADGEEVEPAQGTFGVVKDIMDSLRLDYGLGKWRKDDMSLRDYAVDFVASRPMISERNKVLAPRYLQHLEMLSGQSWIHSSAADAISNFYGRDAFVLDGYEQIYRWVWDKVNWSLVSVLLSTPVSTVTKSPNGDGYLVITQHEGHTKQFLANYVLCTIPLGVLRHSYKEIFSCGLPIPLTRIIDQSSMGFLGKVIFEFEKRFWDRRTDTMFVIVDNEPEAAALLRPGQFPVVFSNALKNREQPALVALIAPPLSQYLESYPQMAFEFLLPALRALRTDKSIPVPAPTYTIVSDWSQNPYFRGSYSGSVINDDTDNAPQHFMDGAGRLRFAGEHTVFEGNGCVHGAYTSGQREAQEIIDMVRTDMENTQYNCHDR